VRAQRSVGEGGHGILVAMGYDLHLTRALFWPDRERFPIRAAEVTALVEREADLALDGPGEFDPTMFFVRVGPDDALQFWRGGLSAKTPQRPLIRRMVEIGHLLDAWVIGDDGEYYGWNGEVTAREPTREELPGPAYLLVGAASPRGYSWEAPILEQAWLELVSAQADFTVMPWVQARLPSGRTWIPCPRLAYWNGHPTGRPIPFFFDQDHIEATADPATLARLRELAPVLDARVLDEELKPA
jgi:hypothetical protein